MTFRGSEKLNIQYFQPQGLTDLDMVIIWNYQSILDIHAISRGTWLAGRNCLTFSACWLASTIVGTKNNTLHTAAGKKKEERLVWNDFYMSLNGIHIRQLVNSSYFVRNSAPFLLRMKHFSMASVLWSAYQCSQSLSINFKVNHYSMQTAILMQEKVTPNWPISCQ